MSRDEWFTVQDCIGSPGFPQTAPGVRKRLDDLAKERADLRRKRSGTKAYEYHLSLLPKYVQEYVTSGAVPNISMESSNKDDVEPLQYWEMIFKLLTLEEQHLAISIFKHGGLNALLPAVMAQVNAQGNSGQEILQQRDSDKNGSTTASLTPHEDKKAG